MLLFACPAPLVSDVLLSWVGAADFAMLDIAMCNPKKFGSLFCNPSQGVSMDEKWKENTADGFLHWIDLRKLPVSALCAFNFNDDGYEDICDFGYDTLERVVLRVLRRSALCVRKLHVQAHISIDLFMSYVRKYNISLRELSIRDCTPKRLVLQDLEAMTQLTTLRLHGCHFSGVAKNFTCAAVKTLVISGTRAPFQLASVDRDGGEPQHCPFPALTSLTLSLPPACDPDLSCIALGAQLRELSLQNISSFGTPLLAERIVKCSPLLAQVSFLRCGALPPFVLQLLCTHCAHITHISLLGGSNCVTTQALACVAEKYASTLVELHLPQCSGLQPNEKVQLTHPTAQCTGLQVLNLERLIFLAPNTLNATLQHCHSLTELNISNLPFKDDVLYTIATACAKLTKLGMRHKPARGISDAAIRTVLTQCALLQEVALSVTGWDGAGAGEAFTRRKWQLEFPRLLIL
jgi:hypothetical protein